MIQRQGAGKVKHLTVRQLWLQQQAELGVCVHNKIPRLINAADMLTHHWTKTDAENHLKQLNCQRRRGDAKDAGVQREVAPVMQLPRGVQRGSPAGIVCVDCLCAVFVVACVSVIIWCMTCSCLVFLNFLSSCRSACFASV